MAEGRWIGPEVFEVEKRGSIILVGVRSRNYVKGCEEEQEEKRSNVGIVLTSLFSGTMDEVG